MCIEHVWLFRDCRHSCRSRTECENARRGASQQTIGCLGALFGSSPARCTQVRFETHYDSSPCRPCQKAARDKMDRERKDRAEQQAREAEALFGWNTGSSNNNSSSSSSRTEAHRTPQPARPLSERPYRHQFGTPLTPIREARIGGRQQPQISPTLPLPPVARAITRNRAGHRESAPSRPRQQQPAQRRDAPRARRMVCSAPVPRRHVAENFDNEPEPDDDFLDMVKDMV